MGLHYVFIFSSLAKMKLVNSLQMYPICGKRYRCQDCTELIGFDLCEAWYTSSSNLPGRFNQQHTPDHRMEVVNTELLPRLLGFHGIPEEGPEELMVQEVVMDPGAMMQFFAGNQEMENNGADSCCRSRNGGQWWGGSATLEAK
jgi:hypothetical protein